MVGIRYIEKNHDTPNGQIIGEIFEEASWIYNEDEFPFTFQIKLNGNSIWESNLYPNTWSSWHCLDNENLEAFIKDSKDNIISYFKLDIWCNRNSTEQFFNEFIRRNPNSNGIAIGTHDGTTGEWVKHVKNRKTNVLLVEGSKKQFSDLVNNYYNFENVKFRNEIITSDGRHVKFFEYAFGYTNTVDEEHYKKHAGEHEVEIINKKSVGINDLIIQEDLQNNLDWLHLDTEAIDDEIIMGLDFNRIGKPKLIVFETINFSHERTGSTERLDKVFNWLESNGYRTKYDYWNSYAFLK